MYPNIQCIKNKVKEIEVINLSNLFHWTLGVPTIKFGNINIASAFCRTIQIHKSTLILATIEIWCKEILSVKKLTEENQFQFGAIKIRSVFKFINI